MMADQEQKSTKTKGIVALVVLALFVGTCTKCASCLGGDAKPERSAKTRIVALAWSCPRLEHYKEVIGMVGTASEETLTRAVVNYNCKRLPVGTEVTAEPVAGFGLIRIHPVGWDYGLWTTVGALPPEYAH